MKDNGSIGSFIFLQIERKDSYYACGRKIPEICLLLDDFGRK